MELLCLYFLINFCLSSISSRTIFIDENDFKSPETKSELHVKPKELNEDNNIVWTKVEKLSDRGIHTDQDRNNSGLNDIINTTSEFLKETNESDGKVIETKMSQTWIENEPAATETLFTVNTLKDDFIGNHSQALDYPDSFESSDSLNNGNLSSSMLEFESSNISDVAIFSFVDVNNEATVAETLIDSESLIEPITSNDTLLIDGDTVLFQEASTFDFQFLIDSESTRNSLLSKLLNSQNIVIASDDNDEFPTLLNDWERSAVENHFNSSINEDSASILPNIKDEAKNFKSDVNLAASEQDNADQKMTPKCPDPGRCFFWVWFQFQQNNCDEDNQCLGPRICCQTGCSKSCVDV